MIATVTAVTIAGAFVVGMVLVLLGNLGPVLAKRLNLSEGRGEWLVSGMNLSLIPMMLGSGIWIDELGVRNVLFMGALVTALGVFFLGMSQTPAKALGSILLVGVGGACLSTGVSVLMADAFFGEGREAASQNLGNVFFGLGALLAPALADWSIQRLGHYRALNLVALITLLPAMIALLTVSDAPGFGTPKTANLVTVFRHPALWVAGLMFFLYGPVERLLGTWASQYLGELGFRERGAAWLLTVFWMAFLAARLGAAFLQWHVLPPRNSEAWVIVVLALAAAVCLGNLAGARSGVAAGLAWLLVGAFLGPIFPTLVGALFDYFPQTRGTAYGAMFALGSLGNLFLPPVIGAYARSHTVHRAMRIPMVMTVALALVAVGLGLGQSLLLKWGE
jgi:fucose permease